MALSLFISAYAATRPWKFTRDSVKAPPIGADLFRKFSRFSFSVFFLLLVYCVIIIFGCLAFSRFFVIFAVVVLANTTVVFDMGATRPASPGNPLSARGGYLKRVVSHFQLGYILGCLLVVFFSFSRQQAFPMHAMHHRAPPCSPGFIIWIQSMIISS